MRSILYTIYPFQLCGYADNIINMELNGATSMTKYSLKIQPIRHTFVAMMNFRKGMYFRKQIFHHEKS